MAAAANTPSGGQPRTASASRPMGVTGWRSSGPRNRPSPAVAPIHVRMPPPGGLRGGPGAASRGSRGGGAADGRSPSSQRVPVAPAAPVASAAPVARDDSRGERPRSRRRSPLRSIGSSAGRAAGRPEGRSSRRSMGSSAYRSAGRRGRAVPPLRRPGLGGLPSRGSPNSEGAAAGSSGRPSRDRRARAWYSGPCLRGSAYSRGLIVQYVPLDAPYHVAPLQPGSKGSSSAPSYEVEPGVAARAGPRRLDGRRGRPDGESGSAGPGRAAPPGPPFAVPGSVSEGPVGRPLPSSVPGGCVRSPAARGRAPGDRRPSARPEARARDGSARHGSRGPFESAPRLGSAELAVERLPARRPRTGSVSSS